MVVTTYPTSRKPDAAIFDPATGLLLVMNGLAGGATLMDPKTGTSPGRIQVGGELEYGTANRYGKVFVNVAGKAEVAIIDNTARRVVAHYPLPGSEDPSGLGIDIENGILVAACGNQNSGDPCQGRQFGPVTRNPPPQSRTNVVENLFWKLPLRHHAFGDRDRSQRGN